MAHTQKRKDKMLEDAIKYAEENECHFLDDVLAFLPISRQTFYDWDFDKSDKLKDVIDNNKRNRKAKLRKKWSESDNATLNVALYKLLSTPEERDLLSDNSKSSSILTDGVEFVES